MKYIIYVLLGCIALATVSCEKVVTIKLNDAAKKYVIEGTLSDVANSCKVYITQTKSFDENNDFPGVSGAQVTIADGDATPEMLTETSPGVYETNAIRAVEQHTYRLNVVINGQSFTASSTVPSKVFFDSVYIRDNTFFNEKIKLLNFRFQDPAGKGNYYKFVQYINGEKDKSISVRDDILIDGNLVDTQLFSSNEDDEGNPSKIKKGDVVKAEMLCIDAATYKYWYSLNQGAKGQSESASPANPVTNISGGALGYFSAYTYQTETITAP